VWSNSLLPPVLLAPVTRLATGGSAEGPLAGSADCEAVADGFPLQPVNTVTSLAYVAAAGWVLARWYRRDHGRPISAAGVTGVTVAVALAATGLGSVAYHGWGNEVSRWLHDAGFLLAMLTLVLWDAGPHWRLVNRHGAGAGAVLALAVLVGAAVPGFANVALTVLLAVIAWSQVRRWPERSATQRRRLAWVVGVLVVALAVYVMSRTGAPLCRPDSLLQGHGLWHVLTAIALAGWASVVLATPPGPTRRIVRR